MKFTGTILVVIGILLIGLGGTIFIREQVFIRTAEQAVAVVTGNESVNYTGNINTMGIQHYYCSVFQFQTRDGQTISFKETEGRLNSTGCGDLNSAPDHKIGQEVPVYYDPRDPANTAQIPKLVKKYYTWVLTITLIGLLQAAIGIFFLREHEQNRKREAAKQQKIPGNPSAISGGDTQMKTAREVKKKRK